MMSQAEMAKAFGYSPAVRAGGLLFCSGVFGSEPDGVVPVDPARQFRLAFEALGELLAAEGCSPADLVELVSYHVRYPDPELVGAFVTAKAAFLRGALPAWTAVGVAALGYPETLVEIRAVARIR